MNTKISKILILPTLIGLGLSFYLMGLHFKLLSKGLDEKSFCSINEWINCDIAAASSYGEFHSIPVAGLGFLFYLVILFYLIRSLMVQPNEKGGISFSIILSTIGVVISLLMAYLSFAKLSVLCLFCVGMYLVNIILFVGIPAIMRLKLRQLPNFFSKYAAACLGKTKLSFEVNFLKHAIGVIVFFAIGSGILLFLSNEAASKSNVDIDKYMEFHYQQPVIPLETTGRPVWGNENAKIKIVEFSDFQCPFCKRAAVNLKPSLAEFKDDIALYFFNYPLDLSCNRYMTRQMHPKACEAAKSALCAHQQNKFWPYHDLVFENQKKLSSGLLVDFSKQLGLDTDKMQQCVLADETQELIEKDLEAAKTAQVRGTPTIYINGRRMGPWHNRNALRAIIKKEKELVK